MSCEYAKGTDPLKCEITARPCLVISDNDRTAYRHCLAREWKHKLETEPAPDLETEPAPDLETEPAPDLETEPAADCLDRKLRCPKDTPNGPGGYSRPGPCRQ